MSRLRRHDEAEKRPVLILTIANGSGHTRVAQGLAAAIRAAQPALPVMVVDVADYMTRLARFTHVTSYLWLVKQAPALWDLIDRYQKRQTQTSPDWYYRRGCKRLFELASVLQPRALIATEVGCCEIAALIKRDLALKKLATYMDVTMHKDKQGCFVVDVRGVGPLTAQGDRGAVQRGQRT